MDDLTNGRGVDSGATCVVNDLGLFFDKCVFVQPGTGRRPVDWCRNKMSVL